MNVCKYGLILMIFGIACLFFVHYVSPIYIENIFGIEWDRPLYMGWTIARVLMNIILTIGFFSSLIGVIITIITEKIYLEWKRYILWLFLYVVFGILLLPYVAVMENKEIKYRWFRIAFYFYTMLLIVNFSWFISGILSDLGIIGIGIYKGLIESM